MRWTVPILASLFLAATVSTGPAADEGHVARILDRLNDANKWRSHVMIVAHRAGWKENGRTVRAENSLAAIENAAATGVEMVELDVRRSADGTLVVMHDPTLERTTTCKGEVDRHTLAELRRCRLVIEDTREATDEAVPTLTEALSAAKGRILINIDNKLGPAALPEIAAQARGAGMAGQILVKENLWNAARIAETRDVLAKVGVDVTFMPILADDAVRDAGFMATATSAFAAPAAELINWHRDASLPMTVRGGPLFSARARAAAILGNWHMWVNTYTITDRPVGMVAGGRGDELAVRDSRPDEAWGFWADRGATIIQTDEPKAAIAWLAANGYRIPYDLTN
ncbi:MAG: glycerophosphodiester phosphodiesterase family protein [Shinella sp.]|nr:glycerophosphodiester phosphodiesterase family protein [Shinella sp.]